METRYISLTLEKAKEWYNSGNATLKEVALRAFNKQELITKDWKNIKTFEDACNTLNVDSSFLLGGAISKYCFRKHLSALYKLDIIRQALNKGYKPSLIDDKIYYPWVRLCKDYDDIQDVIKNSDLEICGKVKLEGTSYYLVGGDYIVSSVGLGSFYGRFGAIDANLGLLRCESLEIAKHIGRYFAKEIFDAVYGQYDNYEWIENGR
jgi:hypothetical protein